MNDTAIRVQNLSKRYRIGLEEEARDTLAATLTGYLKRPLKNLRNLRRLTRFGDNGHDPDDVIWALKDVSFEVQRGEVVGIIGRNGAGKSTLLKILSRITHPTSGRVELRGRVSSLLEVGTGFHPELTGRENVYLNGTILGMRKVEVDRKFDEIVDFSGVEKFIDTPVKRYSSGMKVRLAFAVAAHLEPEILLIDEVLAVGDSEFQKKCLGKMEDIAQEGRTVLFVSHNMGSVVTLCKRAYWLDQGEIKDEGKPSTVINKYLVRERNQDESLVAHPGRADSKLPLLKKVRLIRDGVSSFTFATDDTLEIEVECRADKDLISYLYLGFVITDSMNRRVFATNMNQYDKALVNSGKRYLFRVQIDRLPLSPGVYWLSLHLSNGIIDVDIVENAIRFDVLWNNELDPAHPPRPNWGPLYTPVRWHFEEKVADGERIEHFTQ